MTRAWHTPLLSALCAAAFALPAQAADCPLPEGFSKSSVPTPLSELVKHDSTQRLVLLNVWAVWCAPCRAELPLLDKIAQDKDAPLEIITLNLGDDPAQIDKLYQELHISALPRYNDGDHDLLKKLGGVGLPLSVWFLDGNLIAKSTGALHDGAALLTYARCLNPQTETPP